MVDIFWVAYPSGSIIYKIKCISCEEREKDRLKELYKNNEELQKEKLKTVKTAKYIGESSRSAFEHGFEHLDKLASLNSKSLMLRHMLDKHELEDFSEVRWGMATRLNLKVFSLES